jgi:hypothetical protein
MTCFGTPPSVAVERQACGGESVGERQRRRRHVGFVLEIHTSTRIS